MNIQPLSYDLAQASRLVGASVGHLRVEISKGNLKAKKNGRKVTVLRADLEKYLERLPDWTPGKAPKAANEARRNMSKSVPSANAI